MPSKGNACVIKESDSLKVFNKLILYELKMIQ